MGLLARATCSGGEDVRRQGSGATGASNVWRAYGRTARARRSRLDVLKGFVPAFVGLHEVSALCGILAGAAAMAGHARPLFLRFAKGGKMVATAGGVVIAVAPWVALAIGVVWLATFALTRYTSVASIVSAVALPLAAAAFGYPAEVIAFTAISAAAIVWLHRGNLRRLRAGTENRFRWRRTSGALLMPAPGFADLVDLACHDLRSPLATASGFAKTMIRAGGHGEKDLRYLQMIDEASAQMVKLLDQLGLATRIAAGRYEPILADADTLALAAASGAPAEGEGTAVETDADVVTRALTALAAAAVRFGDAPSVAWTVAGRDLRLAPVGPEAAPVVDGSSPRDLGALVARAAIEALGGELAAEGETLRVRI